MSEKNAEYEAWLTKRCPACDCPVRYHSISGCGECGCVRSTVTLLRPGRVKP